ncbi:unnamed protein product [Acidithrix sp. C25]|nr:unnamed protein product [Acidithrix sp. C25]
MDFANDTKLAHHQRSFAKSNRDAEEVECENWHQGVKSAMKLTGPTDNTLER